MVDILSAIISVFIEIISAIASAVAELFVGLAGVFTEGIGLLDFATLVLVVLIEIVMWIFLLIREMIQSVIKLRKPKKVSWPVIWRPTKKGSGVEKQDKEK